MIDSLIYIKVRKFFPNSIPEKWNSVAGLFHYQYLQKELTDLLDFLCRSSQQRNYKTETKPSAGCDQPCPPKPKYLEVYF